MKLTLIYTLIVKGSYIFFYIFYISTVLDILFLIESVQQNVQYVSYQVKKIDCNSYSFKLTRLKYTLSS